MTMIASLWKDTTVCRNVMIRVLYRRSQTPKQAVSCKTESSFHSLSNYDTCQYSVRKHDSVFCTHSFKNVPSFTLGHTRRAHSSFCYVGKVEIKNKSKWGSGGTRMCMSSSVRTKTSKKALETRNKMGALHGISVSESSAKRRENDGDNCEKCEKITKEVEHDVIMKKLSSEELYQKYDFLKGEVSSPVEHVIDVNYGYVRVDKHNRPASNQAKSSTPPRQDGGIIDKQTSTNDMPDGLKTLPSANSQRDTLQSGDDSPGIQSSESVFSQYSGFVEGSAENYFRNFLGAKQTQTVVEYTVGHNAFEEQYFGSAKETEEATPESLEDKSTENFFDEQYFTYEQEASVEDTPPHSAAPPSYEPKTEHDSYEADLKFSESVSDTDNLFDQQYISTSTAATEEVSRPVIQPDTQPIIATDANKKPKHNIKPNVDNPSTAFDMAMKIRLEKQGKLQDKRTLDQVSGRWKGEVDSHGFRVLRDQVVDVHRLPESTVLSMLHDSIVYDDENITAINKPYGLPSHGGPGVHNSVGKFIESLAEKVSGKPRSLHLVHRLDKETTGIMVLAKSERVALDLRRRFKKREVLKKYLVITKGVPKPTQGMIDIPLTETKVHNKYRMILAPDYNQDTKLLMKKPRQVDKFPAVTYYRVLDSNHSAALIECQPDSGIKHQIRCHLAFGLNTPILGDHKYSHFSKTAPQKLFPEMLQRLGVRQSKVRYIPMHLHAASLILPEFRDGRNLFLSARLPKHFLQNMKWLKLKMPS